MFGLLSSVFMMQSYLMPENGVIKNFTGHIGEINPKRRKLDLIQVPTMSMPSVLIGMCGITPQTHGAGIRQQLQVLRDTGLLLHVERGVWRLP